MLTLPNRQLPKHVLDVHFLATDAERAELQRITCDRTGKWEEGRLGTGYWKTKVQGPEPLFNRARLALDAFVVAHEIGALPATDDLDQWLVYFPPGAFAARHRDVVEDAVHVRLVMSVNGCIDRLRLHGIDGPPVTTLCTATSDGWQQLQNAMVMRGTVNPPLPGTEVASEGEAFVFAPSLVEHEMATSKYGRLFYTVGGLSRGGAR